MKKTTNPGKPMLVSKKIKNIEPMGIKKSTGAGSISPYENEMTGANKVVTPKRNTMAKAVKVNRKANEKIAKIEKKGAAKAGKFESKATSLKSSNPYKSSVASSRATLQKFYTKKDAKRVREIADSKMNRIANEQSSMLKKEAAKKAKKTSEKVMTPGKLSQRRAKRKLAVFNAAAILTPLGVVAKSIKENK